MGFITSILPYIQIVLAVLLVGGVLLQQTSASAGGAFGGSDGTSSYHTRRGAEKALFNLTILIGALFALSSVVALFLN